MANLILNIVWAIFNVLFTAVRCSPVEAGWNIDTPGKCVAQKAVFLTTACTGLVCDLITWSLPIPMVLRLQMQPKNKLSLCVVFALGLV